MTAADPGAGTTVRQLIMGFRSTYLIAAAAEFGIPDLLASGPRSSAELADLAGVNPDALHRVLRALAHIGIVTMLDDDHFSLAPLGEPLRTDVPGSLSALARLWGAELNQRPWIGLQHSIRTGETAFDHIFGMGKFEYLATRPDIAAIYTAGMSNMTQRFSAAVPEAYDFGQFGTFIDIGGGAGTLTAAILSRYPQTRGIVFDLPHSKEDAVQLLAAAGELSDRSTFVDGDFFKSVPSGADAYVLKWVIHDWDDARSIAILRTCRRAMAPGSKLLLVEFLLPSGNESGLDAVMADVNMLIQAGGRERTQAEYSALLEAADLRLVGVTQTSTPMHVLEAVPA